MLFYFVAAPRGGGEGRGGSEHPLKFAAMPIHPFSWPVTPHVHTTHLSHGTCRPFVFFISCVLPLRLQGGILCSRPSVRNPE